MARNSSYLQHLPPVLWRDDPVEPDDPDGPGFTLGGMLRIFEKVLTGIADDAAVAHTTPARGPHHHGALTDEIARLALLFDPWKTPAEFLPWLADWVALRFPTLQGEDLWDEYQQRKATAGITAIHRLRGLRTGLNRYLELYATGRTRPRVALDDGSRVLTVTPQPTGLAPVAALVSQGPVVVGAEVRAEGLVRPTCIAAGGDGSLFLGDAGVPSTAPVALRKRLWRISATGAHDLAGTPPTPSPLAPALLAGTTSAVAVAVAPPRSGRPETLYVLDSTGKVAALPAPYLDTTPTTVVATLRAPGRTFDPAAMCVDRNGDLLVADRGAGPGTPSPPQVVSVALSPVAVTRTPLTKAVHPLSLLVLPDGRLLVGDGREQDPGPGQLAGNLVAVDRSNPAAWAETVLLPADNPLVAPTGLARGDDGRLYVLDAGLKPLSPDDLTDPFVLPVAEPAGLFRVDLAGTPPVVWRITEPGSFVYPLGMVAAQGRLVVCDPGQPDLTRIGFPTYWPRLRPHRFDVVIHFADLRLPADPGERQSVMLRAVGDIQAIVEQQKPAHTFWNPIIAVDSA